MTGSMLRWRWLLLILICPFMCNPQLHVKFLWVEPLITRNNGNPAWLEGNSVFHKYLNVRFSNYSLNLISDYIFNQSWLILSIILMSKKYSSSWQHLFWIFLPTFEIGSFFCVLTFCIPIHFQECIMFQ